MNSRGLIVTVAVVAFLLAIMFYRGMFMQGD